MAKLYKTDFLDTLETQYNTGLLPLMSLSAMAFKGGNVNLVPIEGKDSKNGNTQVALQRAIRGKASASVADPTKGIGDNFIARINTAQRVDWSTVELKSTVKKDFLFDVPLNTEYDPLTDSSLFTRTIANKAQNLLIDKEEMAVAKIQDAITPSGTIFTIDKTIANDEKVIGGIEDIVEEVQGFSDKFKHWSQDVVVICHPSVARAAGRLHGKAYHQGTDTFPNGVGKSFTYNGTEFFVSQVLNSFAGKLDPKTPSVIGAVILDREAFVDAGLAYGFNEFDQVLLDERYVGHSYGDFSAIIDPERIKIIEIAQAKAQPKVND